MPYGGMPHDALLLKLEETDPDLVADVQGFDEFHDMDDNYDKYVRSEIIDWSPDAPFLESDQTRRDPALSRSILNLRYNGTRGSNPELPRHPELFYGFTGNDPRGATNDPRFDQMRGHMTSRAANLTVSMGDNDDHHIAERPWTGQAISYAMKEVHRRQKKHLKVFSVQKEGRPWGSNISHDRFAAGDLRAAAMKTGGESFHGEGARFQGGDYGPASDRSSGGVRGVDGARRAGAEIAPWRHTTGDADLGVQKYGQQRRAGQTRIGTAAQGGARVQTTAADHDWANSRRARSTNRKTLGMTMAAAARRRKARGGSQDQDHGASQVVTSAPGSGLMPARDVAQLYRHIVEDQSRRPEGEIQDDEGGSLGAAAGLTPAAHPENAIRAAQAHTTPNAHLTNVEAIVSGLREGTASSRRKIANQIVADGVRTTATAEGFADLGRGITPGKDYGRVAKLSKMQIARPAAAEGLVTHSYRGAGPPKDEQRAAMAQHAYETAAWRTSREALPIGASKAAGEWRSATQGQTKLGDTANQTFGFDIDVAGYQGNGGVGPKSLRAGGDSANLTDDLNEFGEL